MSLFAAMDLENDVLDIQCHHPALNLDISSPRNHGVDKIKSQIIHDPEVEEIAKIEAACDKGNEFVRVLYSYRSLSRAIPDDIVVASEGSELSEVERAVRTDEVNETIIELLKTEMMKVERLMLYVTKATDIICEAVTKIAMLSESTQCTTSFLGKYNSLIRLLDALFKLDSMKDMRSSMTEDFMRYKKTIESRSRRTDPAVLEEMMEVELFLSHHDPLKARNHILLTLRERVRPVRGYDRVFTEMLELCLCNLEANVFVTPDERFSLIRLIPHLMVIIDGDASDLKSLNVFVYKKANEKGIQQLLKRYPAVPLYGDTTLILMRILERAPHFNRLTLGDSYGLEATGGGGTGGTGGKGGDIEAYPDYDLRVHWMGVRGDFSRFTVCFVSFMNNLSRSQYDEIPVDLMSTTPEGMAMLETAKAASDLTLKGLSLLSLWKSYILLAMAWKYTHPSGGKANNFTGQEYEMVIQRNLTEHELCALVDIVSLIKSLQSLLSKAHVRLAPLYRMHQHHRIQQLTRSDMLPLTHRVDKRKKANLLVPLLQIIYLVADYGDNTEKEIDEDYKQYSRKHGQVIVQHKLRTVSTGAARLNLLRYKLHSLYFEDSVYRQKGGLLSRADLEKEDIQLFEGFYKESYFFPYLLDFSTALSACSSVGDLWYREYHLELTRCVQFPIEMSLPWILTERVSVSQQTSDLTPTQIPVIENVFFMLDIYNDAAHTALHVLREQHLFDEIEAEANLVLEQTLVALAEGMYSYYKDFAASNMLVRAFKSKLEEIKGSAFLTLGVQRYDSVMTQRHVSILGRSINFSTPFIRHLVRRIHRDTDTAIKRFEYGDSCSIMELKTLLDVIRHTHSMIAEKLEVDDWSFIFSDANESLLRTGHGRIMTHLLATIADDIIPQFAYNEHTHRFVRSVEMITGPEKVPVKSGALSNAYGALCFKAFDTHGRAARGFLGRPHIEAIIALTGSTAQRPGVFVIIEKCLNSLTDKLQDAHDYMGVLREGMPHCKLPSFKEHVAGCVDYFQEMLLPLLQFEDLKPELFQVFREVGNIVLLLRDISDALSASVPLAVRSSGEVSSSPFYHLIDNDKFPLLSRAASLLSTQGKEEEKEEGSGERKSESGERGERGEGKKGGSLFHHVLKHIEITLMDLDLFRNWTDSQPTDHVGRSTVDLLPEGFYVMWSAVTFLSCLPSGTSSGTPSGTPSPRSSFVTQSGGHSGLSGGQSESPSGGQSGGHGGEASDLERFGDGFTAAGCVLLHCLGEREVYELNDYSHHILRVHAHDSQSAAFDQILQVKGAVGRAVRSDIEGIVATAAERYQLQQSLFNMLGAQWDCSSASPTKKIVLFRPPKTTL